MARTVTGDQTYWSNGTAIGGLDNTGFNDFWAFGFCNGGLEGENTDGSANSDSGISDFGKSKYFFNGEALGYISCLTGTSKYWICGEAEGNVDSTTDSDGGTDKLLRNFGKNTHWLNGEVVGYLDDNQKSEYWNAGETFGGVGVAQIYTLYCFW